VVWLGLDRRKFHTEVPTDDVASHLQEAYTVAAVACFMQTEMYMRQDHIGPEVCSIVMEQNQQLQKRIPEMIHFMRDPINNRSPDDTAELLPGWEAVMPLTKLIDTPACQPKTASSILQLADYCAFAMKRLLQGQKDGPQLVRPFGAHLLSYNLPGGPDMKGLFWNPVHMPSKWPFPIELKDGQFRPKTGALTK
jgi:hypothetical protein